MRPEPNERGFALVAALFVMVVVALVVVAMARLSVNQQGTNSLAIQQARAYQAARAGLEWGIARALGGNCAANQAVSLAGSNLAEFSSVQVTCNVIPYTVEEGITRNIYRLTATAQNGSPATRPDYAYRQLTVMVEN